MISPGAILVSTLLGISSITDVVSDRVWYAQRPPSGYTPGGDGEALLIGTLTGTQDESSKVFTLRFPIRCYAETEYKADLLTGVLFDELNDLKSGKILLARAESPLGQLLTEPDTGWTFSLVYYQVQFLNY